jgi:hypothetical protein
MKKVGKWQRWTKVQRTLPDLGQQVLTWNPKRIYELNNGTLDYRLNLHKLVEHSDVGLLWRGQENYWVRDGDITHWMPLPEGPEND